MYGYDALQRKADGNLAIKVPHGGEVLLSDAIRTLAAEGDVTFKNNGDNGWYCYFGNMTSTLLGFSGAVTLLRDAGYEVEERP